MLRPILDVFVPGHAKTKGSMVAKPRKAGGTYMQQSVAGSVAWAKQVERAVRQVWGDRPTRVGVPIRATITYYLPVTPEMLIERGSGDIDKLERNILDALTKACVYRDDAQVVADVHEKMCADPVNGMPQGVRIQLWELAIS